MTCAIYARVSTKDRDQSCENQIYQMREWAAKNEHAIVEIFTDEVSGSGLKRRPGFDGMLAAARSGSFQMLLFWSLDRLSREGVLPTLNHLKDLDDVHVCWRSHTEAYLDSCGVFRDAVLAILAAVAKQERLRISERVKAGLEVARAEGRIGGRPAADHDRAIMERMVKLREASYSYVQIADLVKQEFGVAISKSSVHRLIGGIA